jgi:hypothetical protein
LTIQHSVIPDGQRHEPKGISTATTKQIYVADGAASGVWRKINDLDMDYSVKANNLFGWNDIADSQYTSGAPRAITATTRTLLTNNALATQTDTTRLGTIWSTASSQFLINDLNAMYILRINCRITAAAAAGTPYIATFELESANGPTVIVGETKAIKGGGNINQLSVSLPFYSGSFINNQALKIYVTPDTAINLYDVGFVIQRTYKES